MNRLLTVIAVGITNGTALANNCATQTTANVNALSSAEISLNTIVPALAALTGSIEAEKALPSSCDI